MNIAGLVIAATVTALVCGVAGQAAAEDGATEAVTSPVLQAWTGDTDAPSATPAGVTSAVAPLLTGGALGPQVGAVVVDAASGDLLYAKDQSAGRVPASTTKILTAAAVLEQFGPDHVLTTRVVAQPDGQVVIVGAGDPTLRTDRDQAGIGPTLENLAQLTAAALARQPNAAPVSVGVDVSLFGGPELAVGWDPADVAACYVRPVVALMATVPPGGSCQPEVPPEITAARQFTDYLAAAGVPVSDATPVRTVAAPGATVLAEVQSPPLAAMVEQVMLDSDNTGAEMLAHVLGGAAAGEASFAGGARATTEKLTAMSVPIAGLVLDDASGMSADNRISPETIGAVLAAATSEEHLARQWAVSSGLPAAGFDGTLAQRFSADVAEGGRGDVRAKTGTLLGVSALAGQVVTETGQLLHFVFLADDTGPTAQAREQLDRAAAALAECGCAAP